MAHYFVDNDNLVIHPLTIYLAKDEKRTYNFPPIANKKPKG